MRVSVFDFQDYREFIKAWINSHGVEKRGLKSELALVMGVSSSLMSQVLKGDKDLSPEQAAEAAGHFAFSELESDYWFAMIEKDRAGTVKLRQRSERKMRQLHEQAKILSRRIRKDVVLSEEIKAIYYSTWIYSGLRNLSSLPEMKEVNDLAKRLKIPPLLAAEMVHFLLQNGLCKTDEKGLTYGPAQTFLEKESPYVLNHHRNWRQRALEVMELRREKDFFFSSPLSLSRKVAEDLRGQIAAFLQQVFSQTGPSPSEVVACLNLDWFDYSISDQGLVSQDKDKA